MDLPYFSFPGWFLVGVATGFGPCISHHMLIVLPFIGTISDTGKKAFKEFAAFSVARIASHSIIGFLSGLAGGYMHNLITSRKYINTAYFLLGGLLVFLSVTILLVKNNRSFCAKAIRKPCKAMFTAGIFIALVPCPVLLGLIAYTAASGDMVYGAVSGLCFAFGTTLSPLLIAAPFFGFIRGKISSQKISCAFKYISAFILFAYGVHLLVSVFI